MKYPGGVNLGFPADSAARQFFVMEYLFGLGVQYVVGLSQTREKDSALYAGHYMDHAQVSLHLILADMALRMTKGHQKNVLQLMLLLSNIRFRIRLLVLFQRYL